MLSKALSVYYIFYIHINENMYGFFTSLKTLYMSNNLVVLLHTY